MSPSPALSPGVTNERLSTEKRAADLSRLKELTMGDVIWVKKPSGEKITCIFLRIADIETWRVKVETDAKIGGKVKRKTAFLYLSVCQWGKVVNQ